MRLLDIRKVYCFNLFNITAIRSDDTLKTASENIAVFDNVVPAHAHPFPVDGCSEDGNFRVTNSARSCLNVRP